MADRYFNSIGDLAAAFTRMAVEAPVMMEVSMGAAARIVKRHVDATFGDKSKLAALSEYTVADRVSMGYSPDEPLLRDGSLLKDHVEVEHHGLESGVGTAEPVQLFSELGFINHRSGTSVPPRPVFTISAQESEPEIVAEIEAGMHALLDGRSISKGIIP